jgi:hypothetical protein
MRVADLLIFGEVNQPFDLPAVLLGLIRKDIQSVL